MRVYKRHGGRFLGLVSHLITQRYHPRAWLNQLKCFMPRPQIIREYFAVFVGFSVFLTKGRERVIRSEKNSVKHQQFKDLVICFSVNF